MKLVWILVALLIIGIIGVIISFEYDYFFIPLSVPENLTDVEITLDRTACYGTCPIYSVKIFGDGTVIYDGIKFVGITGERVYHVSQKEVDDLIVKFYEINYFSLNDRYDASMTDLPTTITSLKVGDERKSIHNYGGFGPSQLNELEQEIDNVLSSARNTLEHDRKIQCENRGGTFGQFFESPPGTPGQCNMPTNDAGKICTDSNQCESVCYDPKYSRTGSQVTGECYSSTIYDCIAVIKNGTVVDTSCS